MMFAVISNQLILLSLRPNREVNRQFQHKLSTSEAVGADSLGRPVSLASFLVDPLATPLSAFFASAAAAVSWLLSCLSAKANSPLPFAWAKRLEE